MKTFFCRLLLPALVFAVAPARAAFSPAIVAGDARWVVYADFDGLRSSALGQELIALVQKAQTEATGGEIGLNIPKLFATVGTVTAYGTNLSADPKTIDGALVVRGTEDLRKILESVLLQVNLAHPEHVAELTDLPFPAYAILAKSGENAGATELVIAFPPEPIVLVSKSKPQLVKARDVFRGSAASLARTSNSPLGKLVGGTQDSIVFAASVVPSDTIFPDKGPQARILQMANSGSIALGESGGDIFAHAVLTASSEAMADKLRKIVEGMMAMLSLAEGNKQQLVDFLNSTKVTKQGETVTLDLSYPSARLAEMIQNARTDQRSAPRPAAMRHGAVVGEWKSMPEAQPAADGLIWHTLQNVRLVNGAIVTLGVQRGGAPTAQLERVEISSAEGASMPLVFRAEHMRLNGFQHESSPAGRGQRRIAARQPASTAQFQFPGTDGVYTIKVGYYNEPTGQASFTVSVREPAPPSSGQDATQRQ